MTKINYKSDPLHLEGNHEASNSVLKEYQDHITSFYDAILVQETLRRKELRLPFSQTDAEEFLKKIRNALSHGIGPSDPSLDSQKYGKFKSPLIEKAKSEGKHSTINIMKKTSIEEAISEWLESLSSNTLKGYERGIRALIEEGYVRLAEKQSISNTFPRTLFDFSNVPHDLVLEKIFFHPTWSPSIKTRNGTAYKNFIKFLETRTEGIITFLRIKPMFPKNRRPSPTNTLSIEQIKQLLTLLKDENLRDYCLVSLYLSSDLKLNETLELRKSDFDQKKNPDISKLLSYFQDLSDNDYIFRTRNGNPIDPMQISRTLRRTFKKIGIDAISLKDIKKLYGLHKKNF